MKAFILAAGLGTRLKPLTDTKPKALVSLNGVPLLERQILTLKAAGYDSFVVNVHHFASMIEEFLASRNNFGCDISISDERDFLRDTGGALRHAAPLLRNEECILIHNVDIISDLDYNKLKPEAEAAATLVVSRRDTNRQFLFDGNMQLAGWRDRASGLERMPEGVQGGGDLQEFAFSGIHFISGELIRRMESWPEKFSIIDFYLNVCSSTAIHGKDVTGSSVKDVGKQADILR